MARLLAEAGAPQPGPRPTLQRANAMGWLDDDEAWITMLDDRNASSHVYDEEISVILADRLPQHLVAIRGMVARVAPLVRVGGG